MKPLQAILFLTAFLSEIQGTLGASKVLLSKVQTLTLRAGKKTTARRVSAIQQLRCVGGDAKSLYEVDAMRCKNEGYDYDENNVHWMCSASLPPEFRLGTTDVQCEGYGHPDDTYILSGSCGVSYTLMLTELGREKYGKRPWSSSKGEGRSWDGLVFFLAIAAIMAWVVYSAWNDPARRQPRAPRRAGGGGGFWGGGGGGGGGDGGSDDPPPPYTRYPGKSTPRQQQQRQAQSGDQGWRPGFWTGAATGAAAAYAAGRSGGRRQNNVNNMPSNSGGGGWFGRRDNGEGSSGSAGPSTERYESSGFGTTSRR